MLANAYGSVTSSVATLTVALPPLSARAASNRIQLQFSGSPGSSYLLLLATNLGSPVSGFPITFAVDGKQYVAVTTGTSLVASSALRLTPELRPGNAANIFVFALQ